MRLLKLALVWGLVHLCTLIDRLPRYDRTDHKWYRHGCYGCYPLGLAQKSITLDERWKVGYWGGPSANEDQWD